MTSFRAYLDLCRVSNLPTVWTNVLAAVMFSGAAFSWLTFLTLSLSLSFFYSGGMCLNDLCDREADRFGKPFRPLPSQRISIRSAALFTTSLFALALLLLLILPYPKALYAGFLLLAVIVVYDRFHKQHPLSVIIMATCRFLVFVVAAIGISGTLGSLVIIAGTVQFLYILVLSQVARQESRWGKRFSLPLIPVMLAGVSLVDGVMMGIFVSPHWLLAGITGAGLTWCGQKLIRGD